jgi:ERCC4-type nuclease
MSGAEIDRVLESMSVLVDTREQDTERARKRYAQFETPYARAVLDFGDYTYQATLPDGKSVYDSSERITPSVTIERKMDLDELAMCFTHERKRFTAEMERAKEQGASVYLLVENASWEKLLTGKYRSKFKPKAYFASLTTFMTRYGVVPIFCREEVSGTIIKEILYRELKEELINGRYDFQEGSL